MTEAKSRYQILSMEPSPERMAEILRDAEIERRLDRADAYWEGHAEGLVEGARQVLLGALRLRFGELPEHVRECIGNAERSELKAWVSRLYDVSSLEELFGAQ